MNRRHTLLALPSLALAAAAPPALAFDIGNMVGAAKDVTKAATLTDEDIRAYSSQMAKQMDQQARVAPAGDKYARRLAGLTAGAASEGPLKLNYKVCLADDINAFAMPDGTIRVYSGLMEAMTDDEVRYVIGHEIGHVKAGHGRKRMQTALATSATQKAATSAGGRVGMLADSELGDLMAKVVRAQHSQSGEREADDFALVFMKRHNYNRQGAITALEKLDKMSGGRKTEWTSTHPAPGERAARLKTQIA